MSVSFAYNGESAVRKWADPLYCGLTVCNENLSLSFHRKARVRSNQNWAVGMSVLELSKYFMLKLWYKVLKVRLKPCSLLYSDTDSAVVVTPGKSSREVMSKLEDVMDFSNLPKDDPLFSSRRENRLGFLKSELPAEEIDEACLVRSKVYALRTSRGRLEARAKGVKTVYKEKIPFETFKACLTDGQPFMVEQKSIQAREFQNKLISTTKVGLSGFMDKRYMMCRVHSVPLGSRLIEESEKAGRCWFCDHPDVLV